MDWYRRTEGPGKKLRARLGTRDGWEGLTRSPRRNSVDSSLDEFSSVDGGQIAEKSNHKSSLRARPRAQNLRASQFRNQVSFRGN